MLFHVMAFICFVSLISFVGKISLDAEVIKRNAQLKKNQLIVKIIFSLFFH